jgi:hypothetical protein
VLLGLSPAAVAVERQASSAIPNEKVTRHINPFRGHHCIRFPALFAPARCWLHLTMVCLDHDVLFSWMGCFCASPLPFKITTLVADGARVGNAGQALPGVGGFSLW